NGNGYYAIYQTTSTGDMVNRIKSDTNLDNHPLDFLANAQFLPEWNVGYVINHSIMVYAVDQAGPYANYGVDQVFFTDSASSSDGVTAGAYYTSANNMHQSLTTSAGGGTITW
ncbi:MAG TPA: hypothetical protein VGR57_08270, partial [Ktedonobacterales bacterium]|nr:hypothetical protein [Ktedonobacterales bacterium]